MEKIFLKDSILNWKAMIEGGSYHVQEGWDRPYEYLEVAYNIINLHKKELELIDVISNLKRAIDNRIKKLSRDYNFKGMNQFGFPKDNFSKLECLGLAKPLMLDKIVSVRNIIEHQFKNPPDAKSCEEFAELVWYFLKSTDEKTRCRAKSIILKHDYKSGYESVYWLNFNVENEFDWSKIDVFGWVSSAHMIDDNESKFCINCSEIKSRDLLTDDSIFISGTCIMDTLHTADVITAFFVADSHL